MVLSEKVDTLVSIEDCLSIAAQQDCVFILPTLPHAIVLWKSMLDAAVDRYTEEELHRAKTHIFFRPTGKVMRLWVPYEREPTMYMDSERWRKERAWYYMTPYHRGDVRV